MIGALSVVTIGCGSKDKNKGNAGSGSGSGSATAVGSGSGSAGSGSAAKAMSADDLVKRFHECWGYWNAAKWDDFKGCYAASAVLETPGAGTPALTGNAAIADMMKANRTAFPDQKGANEIVLVNGKTLIAVTLITGKQSGAFKTPGGELAATNHDAGFRLAQVIDVDDTGHVTGEKDYFDMGTVMGQLVPNKDHPVRPAAGPAATEQVATAKDDAKEKANLAAFKAVDDAFNKHDAKAWGDLLADDVVWSEQASPKDQTKKELATDVPAMWKGFSDLKLTPINVWAAGDFVAATESFDGTNDGDVAMMKLKKTGKKVSLPFLSIEKLDGGKVKAAWIFYQGGGFASQLGLTPPPAKK